MSREIKRKAAIDPETSPALHLAVTNLVLDALTGTIWDPLMVRAIWIYRSFSPVIVR